MEFPENKLTEFIREDEKAKWRPVNNHNITSFTEDEITRITENYGTLIGKGSFGEVYRGILDDGSPVAVKILKNCISPNLKEGFAKEITVHCQINHKNVVRLLGYCSDGNALMMVTEYISRGNLRDVLHGSDDPISLDTRLGIATDCAEALSYMHSSMYQPIIHGDIKPDNILLDGNFNAKLADFGISRLLSVDKTRYTINIVGSRGYMDPEHIETGLVDPKNDVYSFGVVLLELVTRAKASKDGISTGLTRNFTHALEKGKRGREMFDSEIVNVSNMKILDKIGKLAVECLRKDIEERPEMKDVAERLRMLRKIHSQPGQQKPGQWSLWGAQDTTQKVNRQGASISSSNSSVFDKLSSLDIFNRKRTNFMRNGGPILEKVRGLLLFTEAELREITNHNSEFLGNGRFGKVYKGALPDNRMVAVKVSFKVDKDTMQEFAKEVEIHIHMIHKNILKLIGCCLEVDVLTVVYEFAANGSLQETLHGNKSEKLPLDLRLDIAIGSAEGLRYMHSEAIRHGNVKPDNILLDDKLTPKVSDFGLSKLLKEEYIVETMVGSMGYIDPVFMKTGLLTQKSDVYSFGVVLLELITGKKNIYDENHSLIIEFCKVYDKEKSGRAMFDEEIIVSEEDIFVLEEIGMLAIECLKLDIDDRPDMTEVAERLVMVRRDRNTGKTQNRGPRRFEDITMEESLNNTGINK